MLTCPFHFLQHYVLQNTTIPGVPHEAVRRYNTQVIQSHLLPVIYIFSVYFCYVCPAKTQETQFLRCAPCTHFEVSIRYNGESWYDKKKNSLSLCSRISNIQKVARYPCGCCNPCFLKEI